MGNDYWDIDEILSSEESLDCKLITDAPGLGHLDPLRASTGARDLPRGCILNLPIWMVKPLANLDLVELIEPENYKSGMQNVLRRGSEGARLGEKSRNFFRVGLNIAWLFGGRHELASALFHGLTQRIKLIVDRSAHCHRNEDAEADFIHLLTEDELAMYLAGVSANEKYDDWRHGRLFELKPKSEIMVLLKNGSVEAN